MTHAQFRPGATCPGPIYLAKILDSRRGVRRVHACEACGWTDEPQRRKPRKERLPVKVYQHRMVPGGWISIEDDCTPATVIDATRRVKLCSTRPPPSWARRPCRTCPRTIAPVIATIPEHVHDRSCYDDPGPGHGQPSLVCNQIAGGPRFVPCNPEPKSGLELWRWAYNVGACKRVLALGRAYGLPHATRRDVFRWDVDNVRQVYHEIQVKPAKGAKA